MDRLLDIYRAARLAGVKPAELQRRVMKGELSVEDGKLHITELRAIYPEIELKKTGMVEVVSQIKDDAIRKAIDSRNPHMGRTELLKENEKLKTELIYYKRQTQRHKQCIDDLRGMLVSIKERLERKHAIHIENVLVWLRQKMKENKQG